MGMMKMGRKRKKLRLTGEEEECVREGIEAEREKGYVTRTYFEILWKAIKSIGSRAKINDVQPHLISNTVSFMPLSFKYFSPKRCRQTLSFFISLALYS